MNNQNYPTDSAPPADSRWPELFASVQTELEQTERLLMELVESQSPTVRDVVNYTVGSGGKRLRPALVLLCAQACGQCGERAVRLAAAVELVHSGSLLHDDVFDGSERRRGTESAWRRFGIPATVLVGDFMAAAVYRHLCNDGDSNVMGILSDAVIEMCEAELLSLERGSETDEASYLKIVGGKTAALFAASCQMGARAGGAGAPVQAALSAYGRNVGMAFQITDDLLDLYGDPEKLGKSVGQDQSRGLLTLAVIHAMDSDNGAGIARMVSDLAQGRGDAQTAARLAERVAQAGGRSYAESRAHTYASSARQHLEKLEACPGKQSLLSIPEEIVGRIT